MTDIKYRSLELLGLPKITTSIGRNSLADLHFDNFFDERCDNQGSTRIWGRCESRSARSAASAVCVWRLLRRATNHAYPSVNVQRER